MKACDMREIIKCAADDRVARYRKMVENFDYTDFFTRLQGIAMFAPEADHHWISLFPDDPLPTALLHECDVGSITAALTDLGYFIHEYNGKTLKLSFSEISLGERNEYR